MKFVISLSLISLLLIGVAQGAPSSAPVPDLIVFNAKVFTGNPDQPAAEAFSVRAGKIEVVGRNSKILFLAGERTRRIDAGNRRVIPGFNDPHTHVLPETQGVHLEFANPNGSPADPEVTILHERVSASAAKARRGEWIFAEIGAKVLDDGKTDRAVLDALAPWNPVILSNFAGHLIILNSAALKALGILDDATDPAGGWYGRESNSRRLNGYLYEYAAFAAERVYFHSIPIEQALKDYKVAGEQLLRFGITSIQDMPVTIDETQYLQILRRANLPIRWRVMRVPFPSSSSSGSPAAFGNVKISGRKYILDGTPIERDAFVSEAYLDRPGSYGRLNLSRGALSSSLMAALRDREQALFHSVGDASTEALLSAMESIAPPSQWRPLRFRIEHGDLITPDQLRRAKEMGMIVVENPTHLALPALMSQRFAPVSRARLQPLRSLLRAGIAFALGSDEGAGRNPFVNLLLATIHPDQPSEAISREEAVVAYTRGAAYAEFEEKRKGAIQPGYLADFAVLTQDILAVPNEALPATESLLTVIGGQIAYHAASFK